MTYEKLEILSRIYNTLLLINTKGEDTLIMADCLRGLKEFITNEHIEFNNTLAQCQREATNEQ